MDEAQPPRGRSSRTIYPRPDKLPSTSGIDENLFYLEGVIRIFERVMEAAGEDPELGGYYFKLYGLYMDILEDELQVFGFTAAYHLFSGERVIRDWREEHVRRLACHTDHSRTE